MDIINREISWLSFNHSVLQEAADQKVPLVERLRFLGIFSNNLDEFFKVRVASMRRLSELGVDTTKLTIDDPKNVLSQIQKTVIRLQKEFDKIYAQILVELQKEGIYTINETQLNASQKAYLHDFYLEMVVPELTPIMLNQVKSFPELKDKSIYLAVKLSSSKHQHIEYSLIELPRKTLPRFIRLPSEKRKKFIIVLDDVIRAELHNLFRNFNYDQFEAYTIKITRDAELDIDNDLTKSFLEKISKGVKGRKKGQPVRYVYDKSMPEDLQNYLNSKLRITSKDNVIPGGRYHNFKDYMEYPNLGSSKLEYKKMTPLNHPAFTSGTSILKNLEKKDALLYYPYHGFTQFINLIREAAIDPEVTFLGITLYRVAWISKVVSALINASLNGKEVTVIIELQARFDEESNIHWSRKLEEAGAKVIFGIPGLKVHSKLFLIGRNGKEEKTHYTACISTGNFHEGTARVYSDVTLFTTKKKITKEVRAVFDFIEYPYKPVNFKHLLVSPNFMRPRLLNLIDNEIINAQQGLEAYIVLKINNLVDRKMILRLYAASQAGVRITLVVRGICSLKPGVPGLSDNITGVRIVGRFLEHSRIFIFCNGGKEKYYLSSADWMPRNLDHRVEVACPVFDPELQKELKNIIDLSLKDNVKARAITEKQDNPYIRNDHPDLNSQMELYRVLKKPTAGIPRDLKNKSK
jgi:polyphosphate kinase